jgi:phenylacetic acid degradation protein paaN
MRATVELSVFEQHRELLERATQACRTRSSFSAFDGAEVSVADRDEAHRWFAAQVDNAFELDQPGQRTLQHDEVSPYTGQRLGISYPKASVEDLINAAEAAQTGWADRDLTERIGVCLEICHQLMRANAHLGVAAFHTTGQALGMALTGSGTNALDRGLEAIAMAHQSLARVPASATWVRAFGKTKTSLQKRYHIVPLGIAVVVACASFPAWNAYPALLANLATGNPVILKPHPTSVLQMALAVRICRTVLADAGLDPNLVTLAVDNTDQPIAQSLVTRPKVGIVDFTGSSEFGSWIEDHAGQARVYTETSGTNTVILDSVTEIDPVLRSLAGSLCLFSAQMCTTPQNIYIAADGVRTAHGVISADQVETALVQAVQAISTAPTRAAAIMGAIQSAKTIDNLAELTAEIRGRSRILLEPAPYQHPDYPQARTSGPLIAGVDIADQDLYGREHFGPVAFVIRCDDSTQALRLATAGCRTAGAITAFVYSTDEQYLNRAEREFATAGAALSINLTGAMPLNFSAAYSDYHVSGLNPAGNATLTDESFIAGRFRIAQTRRPA